MSSENKKKTKEDLEKKIVELEGKLSSLSNMLSDESYPLTPSMLKKNPPTDPRDRHTVLDRLMSERHSLPRISELDPDDLDPDGSAKRQLLAIAEENYLKQLKKHDTRGTMPKGFGVDPKSPFSLIMSYDKKYAKAILKSKRCLGCKKFLDKQHVILCHECATNKLTEQELNQVIRRFTTWGFYKKSFLTNIALKLKLAKVMTEEKHE